jgi:hypothetical protein
MVRNIFLITLFISQAIASEGMVTVLEAPLFRVPDQTTPVIQYVRKGDRIYVHPVVTTDRERYGSIRPDKRAIRRSQMEVDPYLKPTPEVQNYHDGFDFVLTKDNQGRDAWILRDHVHVWYEDRREFSQKTPRPDPTDYRLLEPLPETYPLNRLETLRANIQFSLGTPLTQTYPYPESIRGESYGYQMELNLSMLKRLQKDFKGRFHAGGVITVRSVTSDYVLQTRRASEQWTKIGFGGAVSYDPWRTDEHRLTLTWSALAYPFNQVSIGQADNAGIEEIRNYFGWNLGSRIAADWQRLKFIGDLNLVAGIWAELESPFQMSANSGTNRPTWWNNGANDKFTHNSSFTVAGQIGIQSTY